MTISGLCTGLPRGQGVQIRSYFREYHAPNAVLAHRFDPEISVSRPRWNRLLAATPRAISEALSYGDDKISCSVGSFDGLRNSIVASAVRIRTKYSSAPMAGVALVGLPSFIKLNAHATKIA